MTTATEPRREAADRFVTWCDWDDYVVIADRLGRYRRPRITFDDGWMEVHMPSLRHELLNRVVSLLVMVAARVYGRRCRTGGSTTFRLPLLQKGAEPDSCFWIAHAEAMRGREEFDPASDPPPDLVVEVDVAASSEHRMAIWATLGVPEVWRVFADGGVRFCRLEGGRYEAIPSSMSFPRLRAEQLSPFLLMLPDRLDSEIEEEFRTFLTTQP
jgi:Uma2 family endonuclease